MRLRPPVVHLSAPCPLGSRFQAFEGVVVPSDMHTRRDTHSWRGQQSYSPACTALKCPSTEDRFPFFLPLFISFPYLTRSLLYGTGCQNFPSMITSKGFYQILKVCRLGYFTAVDNKTQCDVRLQGILPSVKTKEDCSESFMAGAWTFCGLRFCLAKAVWRYLLVHWDISQYNLRTPYWFPYWQQYFNH